MDITKVKSYRGPVVGVSAVIDGRKYTVDIYRNREGWDADKVTSIAVNWSALGSQSTEVAEQYARLILAAVKEAKKQEKDIQA